MKIPIVFISMFLSLAGCASFTEDARLPEQIARHCYEQSESCHDLAIKTATALRACGYQGVAICSGRVYPGSEYHAWVEYSEGGERYVLDGAQLLGISLMKRAKLPKKYYRANIQVERNEIAWFEEPPAGRMR